MRNRVRLGNVGSLNLTHTHTHTHTLTQMPGLELGKGVIGDG